MQELEADFLAGTTGREGGLDRLAAAWAEDGLDTAAAEVSRRDKGLAAARSPGRLPAPCLAGVRTEGAAGVRPSRGIATEGGEGWALVGS